MRADRLLSILMLLQARGRMTAQQLSRRLEVSERTIYRDIDALSLAGVPVYGDRGPDGGYALLDSYRTNLTGLTDDELRALFMLSIAAPLTALGVSEELRAALLKLSAALPDSRRCAENRVRQRIHLDSTWWFQGDELVPHLQVLYDAVWQDRKLLITYHSRFGPPVEIQRLVSPYGLVAKAGIWYLVYAVEDHVRAKRASRLTSVVVTDQTFDRPCDFDLEQFWRDWCAEFEESRPVYLATVRVSPVLSPLLPRVLDREICPASPESPSVGEDGWIMLRLAFESFEEARSRILGFGGAIEVLQPEALRLSIADFSAQTLAVYRGARQTT